MKKNLIIATLMLFSFISFAQDSETTKNTDFGKNRFEATVGYTKYSFKDTDFSDGGLNTKLNYERIFGTSGKVGLAAGINTEIYNEAIWGTLALGVQLNWYITGQGKGFYLGPNVSIGSIVDTYDNSETYSTFGINGGYQFQVNSLFGIRAAIGYKSATIGGDSDLGIIGVNYGVGFNFSF